MVDAEHEELDPLRSGDRRLGVDDRKGESESFEANRPGESLRTEES